MNENNENNNVSLKNSFHTISKIIVSISEK